MRTQGARARCPRDRNPEGAATAEWRWARAICHVCRCPVVGAALDMWCAQGADRRGCAFAAGSAPGAVPEPWVMGAASGTPASGRVSKSPAAGAQETHILTAGRCRAAGRVPACGPDRNSNQTQGQAGALTKSVNSPGIPFFPLIISFYL